MNLKKIEISRILDLFKKKIFIQIYLILFIILNILDFYGISGDLDFFKKILSWILIGNLFYQSSPTKIFIGTRDKLYDFLLIISFSLMTITKSIIMYLSNYSPEKYPIFKFILNPIANYSYKSNLITFSFFIGIILTIIISIKLINKHRIKPDSLIGSFKLTDYLKFIKFDYLLLIIFNVFFAITIFNLFMEWFAIAVDAIILVLGLIYYLYKYISEHLNYQSTILNNISDTGSDFLKELIKTFSNKNTILIGISFILTLHLLVDAGSFLIPYSIGTGSSLYFNNLNYGGTDHTPIFNFKNLTNSQIYNDLNNINILKINELNKNNNPLSIILNSKFLIILINILIYSSILFLFFSFLITPFYILYKNIKKEKIIFNKIFSIIFISSLSLFFLINIQTHLDKRYSNEIENINFFTIPLGINSINKDTLLSGVDIYTNNLIKTNMDYSYLNKIKLIFLLYLLIILLLFKYYNPLNNKISKTIIILSFLFFIIYILIFSINRISYDYSNLKLFNNEQSHIFHNKNLNKFNNIIEETNKNKNTIRLRNKFKLDKEEVELSLFYKYINNSKNHYDYLILKINKNYNKNQLIIPKEYSIYLNKENNLIYFNEKYKFIFGNDNNLKEIIIFIGENKFNLKEGISNNIKKISINNINKDPSYLLLKYNNSFIFKLDTKIDYNLKQKFILENKNFKTQSKLEIKSISTLIQLIFTSIFYFIGITAFSYHFIKSTIFKNNLIKEENEEEIKKKYKNLEENKKETNKKKEKRNEENKKINKEINKTDKNLEFEKKFKYFKGN